MKNRWIGGLCAALAVCVPFAGAEQMLGGEEVLKVEQALYALGYHDDNCDAQLDDYTRQAIRSFQIANSLAQTGEPDAETLALLESGEAVTCHEYLVDLAVEYADTPILQAGSAGDAVIWLQRSLKELGYFSGECDGVFGEATLSAVRRFQLANGLEQTGVADRSVQVRLNEGMPLSWQVFVDRSVAAIGDSGVRVRLLQRTLRDMGYFDGECSGVYGDHTEHAVRKFQFQNNLEQTGAADAATCAALYSGKAAALRQPGTLYGESTGEQVTALQRSLAGLGYFDHSITGFYTETTETAVRLFQLANGLPATGEADPGTLALLESGGAAGLDSARDAFLAQVRAQDATARAVIGSLAMQARGQSFEADDEDLFEGFAFVQYVCVSAGIPVVSPDDIVELINDRVEDFSEPVAGDILAFRMDDAEGMHMMLAISTGDGRAVYATQDSSYVLEGYLSGMYGGELHRWNMEGAAE